MRLAELRQWFEHRGWHRHVPSGVAAAVALAEEAEAGLPFSSHPPAAGSGPTRRLAVVQELWGDGYTSPGGSHELLRYALPLGLSAASSLLLVGAGLGGPAQTLATDLGVWVMAYEADPVLAEIAARRIQRAGIAMAKRATVQAWDRADPAFPRRACHHGLAIEAVRDAVPEKVLSAIADGLKTRGQLVVVETVATEPLDPDDPNVATWCRLEGRPPCLPQEHEMTLALSRLGFDVRVVEDVSARHMHLAVLGWKQLLHALAGLRPSPQYAELIVSEAELWTRRIRLMHAGHIRLVRWHAMGNL
jgi:hypothetical protein